jgi:4-hydroxy-tetrahydrodipicolinate synthase
VDGSSTGTPADQKLGEVVTAIVTPFAKDGQLNVRAFRLLCRHLVESGSDGIVVGGTTGESPTLTTQEKMILWEAAVEEVAGEASVIAGTGTYSTSDSVALTEKAASLGVDGLLVVAPYYNRPPLRGVIEHFRAIAAASELPIVAYNIPRRVVINLDARALEALAEIPSVVAVKETNDDLGQARTIVELGLDLYAGDEHLIFPFLEVGAVGSICPHTHLVGPRVKEMIRRYKNGDTENAEALDRDLLPFYELMGVVVNPIAIKCALNLVGFDVGGLRLPLVEATPPEQAEIEGCLVRLGLLAPDAVSGPALA